MGKFVASSVKAAMESERVAAQTQAVLKSTGGAAGVAAEDVTRLASEMQALTGISDEEIQSSQNLLLTFRDIKAEGGIFEQTTQSVADMAVAMNKGQLAGIDLKSASIQLGKAVNNPIKGMSALARVGVQFTAAQEKQITKMQESGDLMGAQKMILGELQKEFGGAAQAAGGTFEGSIHKLSNAFNDFQENLGSAVMPALNEFIKFASKGVDLLNNISEGAAELGGASEVSADDDLARHVADVTKEFAKGKISAAQYNKKIKDLDALYVDAETGATATEHAMTALGDETRKGTLSTKKAQAATEGIIKAHQGATKAAEYQAKADKLAALANKMLAEGMSKSSAGYKTAASAAAYYAAKAKGLATALNSIPNAIKVTVDMVGQGANWAANQMATGGIRAAANGMIARSPTLIGEGRYHTPMGQGAEAVLPLTDAVLGRLGSHIARASGGGGGGPRTVIHVHGDIYGKPRDFAEAVDRALSQQTLRRAG